MKITNKRVLISIILPVYNAALYLPQCLESLLTQSHEHLEVIAIDDFSRDDSFNILKKFAKNDKRLRISRNVKRYGSAITLNRCLRKARGKFIAFMDASDVSHPHRIQQQLAYLQANEKVVAVGTQCIFLDSENKKTGKSDFPIENMDMYIKPLNSISFQFENLLINKYRIPKDILKFKTNNQLFLYSDVYIKLLQYGKLSNLQQYLYFRRQIPNNNKTTKPIPSLVKIWLRSIALNNYRPSFKSFLMPTLQTRE